MIPFNNFTFSRGEGSSIHGGTTKLDFTILAVRKDVQRGNVAAPCEGCADLADAVFTRLQLQHFDGAAIGVEVVEQRLAIAHPRIDDQ